MCAFIISTIVVSVCNLLICIYLLYYALTTIGR